MIQTNFKKQLDFLEENSNLMQKTLIDWCHINSGSYNLAGLEMMHKVLAQSFKCLDAKIESHASSSFEVIDDFGKVSMQQTGNILTIKKRWQDSENKVLLCGHMDTVFGLNSDFQTVSQMKNGNLNGPGVADMKGGLLVMLYALKAFEISPVANNIGWQVVINADEEIGSLGSRFFLENIAKEADVGLVYEPSMTIDGVFAGLRKGSGKFSIVVEGIESHAGRAFYDGRNAICHLAALISEINSLNDQATNLTINVGHINGGIALNVVPSLAVAKLDVRFQTSDEQQLFLTSIDKLIAKYNNADGFKVKRYGDFSRPAKPLTHATLKLFNLLSNVGESLSLAIDWQPSGGCCDGNNLSAQGLPVIDTLGVRGGMIHSSNEFMVPESLVERSQLSTLLLMILAEGTIKEFKKC